ncbi:hypothetical protein QOT17_000325 [Balamuthia mandrillaris]
MPSWNIWITAMPSHPPRNDHPVTPFPSSTVLCYSSTSASTTSSTKPHMLRITLNILVLLPLSFPFLPVDILDVDQSPAATSLGFFLLFHLPKFDPDGIGILSLASTTSSTKPHMLRITLNILVLLPLSFLCSLLNNTFWASTMTTWEDLHANPSIGKASNQSSIVEGLLEQLSSMPRRWYRTPHPMISSHQLHAGAKRNILHPLQIATAMLIHVIPKWFWLFHDLSSPLNYAPSSTKVANTWNGSSPLSMSLSISSAETQNASSHKRQKSLVSSHPTSTIGNKRSSGWHMSD